MCGIAGIATSDARQRPDEAAVRAMGEALAHRGPDDAGLHIGDGIGLASRRLAILDLSPSGRMPMASDDGAVLLALNGEIYNFVELREELKRRGVRLRTGGDTEVLLRLYLAHGIDCLHKLLGMFAFALWDSRRRTLFLARDRIGVKPLRYRVGADGIRFASELRGLLAEPGFAPALDPEGIHHALALRFCPRPASVYAGIEQVPPGHVLVYEQGTARLQRYWSIPEAAPSGERLATLAERHVALMDDAERPRARETSRLYGMEQHEVELDAVSLDDLETMVRHFDMPFADPSAVPAWQLAKEVARHVKVALVGDGGDELYGGYDRYRAHLIADRFGWLPGLISRTPFDALLEAVSSERTRRNLPGRLRRLLEGWELPARERNALWIANPGARRITRLYQPDFAARVAGIDPTRALGPIPNAWGAPDLLASLLRADQEVVLPDDLLVKADLTSMAFGLELRSPFLDHRVVEFAATVPAHFKVRAGRGKWFLRRVYRGRVPDAVLRARKAGFGMPIDHWFRGDLHAAATDLLLAAGARSRDYLNREAVAAVLKIHRSGQRNYDEMIWTLLVLEIWLRGRAAATARRAA